MRKAYISIIFAQYIIIREKLILIHDLITNNSFKILNRFICNVLNLGKLNFDKTVIYFLKKYLLAQ
jgi:hypothetical protein